MPGRRFIFRGLAVLLAAGTLIGLGTRQYGNPAGDDARRPASASSPSFAETEDGPGSFALTVSDSPPEETLARIFNEIEANRLGNALQLTEALLRQHPNYRLAHLIRGDLLLARRQPIDTFGALSGAPLDKVADLRAEAITRLKAYREKPPADFVPRYLLQMQPDQRFAIVVTTNSGYPLDMNLYQAVKGMSAAALIVQDGGAIVCAAECADGIPEHGLYGQLLRESATPRALLERIMTPGFLMQDQWQAQIQAQVQLKADVYVYADGLTDAQITDALFRPCRNLADTLAHLLAEYGPDATICILPEGPQTIPYVRD